MDHANPLPGYREKLSGIYSENFNGYLYFGFANAVALAGIVGSLFMLREPSAIAWLTIPATFVFANFAEWLAHKGPMHHKRDFMEMLFERHTMVHHIYFPHTDMTAPNHHHWGYVLFPWWAIFLVYLTAAPFALLTGYAAGANCGWLFMATGLAYYLLYEWLHLMHHLPPEHPISRTRAAAWLRKHHHHHHDHRLMARHNFNVSFPIADYVLGTAYRENPAADGHAPASPTPVTHTSESK